MSSEELPKHILPRFLTYLSMNLINIKDPLSTKTSIQNFTSNFMGFLGLLKPATNSRLRKPNLTGCLSGWLEVALKNSTLTWKLYLQSRFKTTCGHQSPGVKIALSSLLKCLGQPPDLTQEVCQGARKSAFHTAHWGWGGKPGWSQQPQGPPSFTNRHLPFT